MEGRKNRGKGEMMFIVKTASFSLPSTHEMYIKKKLYCNGNMKTFNCDKIFSSIWRDIIPQRKNQEKVIPHKALP